jgi:DNA sulfur modification protein DndD
MQFTELVLHNFGVYKGRHIVDLRTKNKKKPIILFGGLNGGGKTTLMEALQLVLYGKFSKALNNKSISYQVYLEDMINKYVTADTGAAIELEFSYDDNNKGDIYRVKRFWKNTGKNIRETVEVLINGEMQKDISELWYEKVDEFIPNKISELFFFDGEKIEDLANPDTSRQIIKTGISSLLGLDLVHKLKNDLTIIEKRKLKLIDEQKTDKKSHSKTLVIDNEITELKKSLIDITDHLAEKRTGKDKIANSIEKLKNRYREDGGELHDRRELLHKEYNLSKDALKKNREEIHDFCDTESPLLLVETLIDNAKATCTQEEDIITNRTLLSVLEDRDEFINQELSKNKVPKKYINIVDQLFESDRSKRELSADLNVNIDIRPTVFDRFDQQSITNIRENAASLCEKFVRANDNFLECDNLLNAIPDESSIQTIAKKLRDNEKDFDRAHIEIEFLQKNFLQIEVLITRRTDDYKRALHLDKENELGNEIEYKSIEQIAIIQSSLNTYESELINKHISRLEQLIFECFSRLLRKKDLVSRISICSTTFSLSVIDTNDQTIPSARLSAGERQILAIAILWGLAKASGRTLPTIIDTPLGRLDGEHRNNFVRHYFPEVSRQVILLSTDKEIDKEYKKKLDPYIYSEYHIKYESKEKSSTISPGYF